MDEVVIKTCTKYTSTASLPSELGLIGLSESRKGSAWTVIAPSLWEDVRPSQIMSKRMRSEYCVVRALWKVWILVVEVFEGYVGNEGFSVWLFLFADDIIASAKFVRQCFSIDGDCQHPYAMAEGARIYVGAIALSASRPWNGRNEGMLQVSGVIKLLSTMDSKS